MNGRALLAASLFLLSAAAHAQSYQDSGGTYVRGIVPISPGAGPLFTPKNPGVVSDPALKDIADKLDKIEVDLSRLLAAQKNGP